MMHHPANGTVSWAEVSARPATEGGVTLVNRVGVRMYMSVGPGGAPSSTFAIGSLSARRSTTGESLVVSAVHNGGGSTLDLGGTLMLSHGPDASGRAVSGHPRNGYLPRSVRASQGGTHFDPSGALARRSLARQWFPSTVCERNAQLPRQHSRREATQGVRTPDLARGHYFPVSPAAHCSCSRRVSAAVTSIMKRSREATR
jgi:hypothetical protein